MFSKTESQSALTDKVADVKDVITHKANSQSVERLLKVTLIIYNFFHFIKKKIKMQFMFMIKLFFC